ncbi:DUF1659 domain-containing protein [Salisediminibacterium halotolerans]|uniref:DUF1659 domain-containing protein n=1 Tax=Salisediminibacterium halotolerans TaxID=517425 RepID=A0A1H9WT66_9BACI|nr:MULTISPECIES: DUF1659 domain-containing protein [Salisediminibacterium]RLJ74490.1 uncharacterized protein DUF1659 [Actinophytocola xinjiangensis]RPE87417.1 uncharacterized protein DUF1659 [Salisediminibacterium halotolerans]TWG35326.1 uncharacterized protein DUF1659 [Salisediminibacterium halotolerans]SES36991.1 Protein of unknown function [Salisediminibacterium haloalkalitolerans]GEL07958.1 hypothetical protein SHA02_13740 [Salisediminibacterium halotolerans]
MNNAQDSRITLVLHAGEDENGELIEQFRHFRNIKTEADNSSIVAVFSQMAQLQTLELSAIERSNTYDLTQE